MSNWFKYAGVTSPVVRRGENLWYKIDSAAINQPIKSGEHIYFEFSPYDVPEEVSGELDKKRGTASIFFRYINDEPTSRIYADDFVAYLGKRSHRLHRIDVQTEATQPGAFVSAFSHAIERLRQVRPSEAPPDKYEIAKEIVSSVGDKLLKKVA
jgi:hypothetical protein